MNPSRILGSVALVVSGGLLLSESFLGQYLFTEMTGIPLVPLRLLCGIVFALGALAIGISVREARDYAQEERDIRR